MPATDERCDVQFLSAGVRCDAWLYRPAGSTPQTPAPLVILAHGIGGLREARLDAYARRFVAAGLGVLAFDYRHFGTSDGHPRQLLEIRRQQTDLRAAIAYAREMDWVDTERIGLWGTSFGAGHVMEVAATDPAIAAVVVQAPFTNGLAAMRALGASTVLGVGLFGIADAIVRLFGRGPVLVPLVGVRGLPAVLTAPDVVGGVLATFPSGSVLSGRLSKWYQRFAANRVALPDGIGLSSRAETIRGTRYVGSVYLPSHTCAPNGVSARFSLGIAFWRPGRALARLRCPALVCVADEDTVTPPGPTLKAANAATTADVRRYPAGHFTIYHGALFDRVTTDQIEFLQQHLGDRRGSRAAASSDRTGE